jgi:hypothetical protein
MFKTIAFATLITASCGAHAATTWTFSYTGFMDANTGVFDASRALEGSFSGHDINGDGYVKKDEITSFLLNGMDYFSCAGNSNDFYQCGTETFQYQLGGALDFSAGERGSDPEGSFRSGHYYISGDQEFDYSFTPYSSFYNAYHWTEQTEFTIGKGLVLDSPVLAVPEPGTWAMLATGLLVMTGAARRRKAVPVRR